MHQADLRSGVSFWQAVGPPPAVFPQLNADLSCDVAVVGGGITGALVSRLLVEQGLATVLVDREQPGCGSTAASTGLLQYQVDTPLVELIAKVGESHAVHAYRRGLVAINELEAIWNSLGRACDFARRKTLYLASSSADAEALQLEHECRRHFGFDVAHLERDGLREFSGIEAPAALYTSGDAEIDPYCFTQAVLARGREKGLAIYHGGDIRGFTEADGHVILRGKEHVIRCRAAVFATGYAAHDFLPGGPGTLHTTYAAVSEPLPTAGKWPDGCLIWETARPYFYARQTADGRALVGGGDTDGPFDHENPNLLAQKIKLLQQRFETMFSGVRFQPAYVWAGTFAETKDGMPYIGRLPGRQSVYCALGYGGNGITFSMIAARLLTDLILQRPNDDAEVFRFER